MHEETTLACLAAGKHVYTKKPAAGSMAAATRLRDEAARRNLTLICAPSVLLYPQVRLAAELLARNEIGPVHAARGLGFGGVPPWSGYPSDPTPFFAIGGGPLVDMGVYPLHAITGLLGPARRVSASAARAQRGFVVADGPYAGRTVPIEVPQNLRRVTLDLGDATLSSASKRTTRVAARGRRNWSSTGWKARSRSTCSTFPRRSRCCARRAIGSRSPCPISGGAARTISSASSIWWSA